MMFARLLNLSPKFLKTDMQLVPIQKRCEQEACGFVLDNGIAVQDNELDLQPVVSTLEVRKIGDKRALDNILKEPFFVVKFEGEKELKIHPMGEVRLLVVDENGKHRAKNVQDLEEGDSVVVLDEAYLESDVMMLEEGIPWTLLDVEEVIKVDMESDLDIDDADETIRTTRSTRDFYDYVVGCEKNRGICIDGIFLC